MLETLAQIFDNGGQLTGVSCAAFDGEYTFITAFAFQFEGLTAVFRAMPDDDTIAANIGHLKAESDEIVLDVGGWSPWPECIGRTVRWAWRLTNPQGYTDGVRLEFGHPDEVSSTVVELVVAASGIRVFVVAESKVQLS